jgi:lysophospholipase L1-like esterase
MKKRICVFGDSVVWGACIPKREAWTDLLRNYLDEKFNYSVDLYNLGIDGNTSKDILKRFDVEVQARNPDVIICAVGANDSIFRNNNQFEVSESNFLQNLSDILKKAKKYTEQILFVGLVKGSDTETIPLKRSATGKCYSKLAVKKYDGYIKSFAEQNNVPFVDVFTLLTDEDFDDGLHPNIQGHSKIFQAVKKTLDSFIS